MSEDADEPWRAFIEIPKGSRNKYELNQETGHIELDRRLFAAVSYPVEYGFVVDTRTEEGEELDAIVAVSEPTFPGCVVPIDVIGMLEMYDEDEPDHKIFGVPLSDPAWSSLHEIDHLPGDLAQEIKHFFEVYTDLEGKDWRIEGWADKERALAECASARERFREQQG
ncbi:MAG: inorganic diphosphatase [Actinomycetota bacterium]|nr:inorganic diphosphatase [Actinomycetota bacterium]